MRRAAMQSKQHWEQVYATKAAAVGFAIYPTLRYTF